MNRKQRRQNGQRGPVNAPNYNLSIDQIECIKKEAADDAMSKAFVLMLGLPLIALRDDFDFGKVRLQRFENKVIELYQSFCKGNITLGDLHKRLHDEVDLKVTGVPEDTDYKF